MSEQTKNLIREYADDVEHERQSAGKNENNASDQRLFICVRFTPCSDRTQFVSDTRLNRTWTGRL